MKESYVKKHGEFLYKNHQQIACCASNRRRAEKRGDEQAVAKWDHRIELYRAIRAELMEDEVSTY